jgi:16S rRNA (cytosine967-C5)-methyltransferase
MSRVNPRRVAYEALCAIEKGAYANLALGQALNREELSEQDRRFVSALVYTTLENLHYIDFLIGSFAPKKAPFALRCLLQLGVCQLLYMNVPASAACNESVQLAKSIGKAGAAGFVNALLRNIDRQREALPQVPKEDPVQWLAITYSWQPWLVKEWLEQFGPEETEKLLSYRDPGRLSIRINSLKATEEEVLRGLGELGLEAEKAPLTEGALLLQGAGDIVCSSLFQEGKIAIQSQSSMLVCRALGAQKGMRVLDCCAAPGGKTAFLAALMGDGQIDAWDVHDHRVELMKKTCSRLGADFVRCARRDASEYDPALEGVYDAVLVDAPCSGLGVAGSKPDIKYAKSDEGISALCALQLKILNNCARYVRPGGALVYSTCTISRRENQGVVEAFLGQNGEFVPALLPLRLPEGFDQSRMEGGALQLLPHKDHTDGFFMQRLVRR